MKTKVDGGIELFIFKKINLNVNQYKSVAESKTNFVFDIRGAYIIQYKKKPHFRIKKFINNFKLKANTIFFLSNAMNTPSNTLPLTHSHLLVHVINFFNLLLGYRFQYLKSFKFFF
jgi:hypothetical protein